MSNVTVHRGAGEIYSTQIANSVGSETSGMTQNSQVATAIYTDKGMLAEALTAGGRFSTADETLEDLAIKVLGLSINVVFDVGDTVILNNGLQLSDSVLESLISGGHDVEPLDTFDLQCPFSITASGTVWIFDKWNVNMTSASTPTGYTVSGTSETSGYEAWKCFSGTNTDDTDCWLTTTGVVVGDVVYHDSTSSTKAISYKITSRNATSGPDESPNAWTFSGSNDGSSWSVLDTQSGITFAQNETKQFFFENTTSYSYYKLSVSLNNGSENFLSIGDIEIGGSPYGTSEF